MRKIRTIIKWCLTISVLAGCLVLISQCNEREKNAQLDKKRKLETAELAPGVRERWFDKVDSAIIENVKIVGGRMMMSDNLGSVEMTPLSQVSIECDSFGIRFSDGRTDGNDVELIDHIQDNEGLFLDFPSDSPAAKELYQDLCHHLAKWLQTQEK